MRKIYHAGAAYWERSINGGASSDNLVRESDSTWTQILAPAAAALAQKIAAMPAIAICTPGDPAPSSTCSIQSLETCSCLHLMSQLVA